MHLYLNLNVFMKKRSLKLAQTKTQLDQISNLINFIYLNIRKKSETYLPPKNKTLQ